MSGTEKRRCTVNDVRSVKIDGHEVKDNLWDYEMGLCNKTVLKFDLWMKGKKRELDPDSGSCPRPGSVIEHMSGGTHSVAFEFSWGRTFRAGNRNILRHYITQSDGGQLIEVIELE